MGGRRRWAVASGFGVPCRSGSDDGHGLTLPRSIERPLRAGLPAGAPVLSRVVARGHGMEPGGPLEQKVLERASANIAFWQPGSAATGAYTHVFEPAALVRVASTSSLSLTEPRRVPITHVTRTVDLAAGLQPIADATGADDIVLNVMWSGANLGTAHVAHHGGVVSPLWMADTIAQQLTAEVLDARLGVGEHVCRALLTADLARHVVGRLGIDVRSANGASPRRPPRKESKSTIDEVRCRIWHLSLYQSVIVPPHRPFTRELYPS